jgi:hypothetical protein
MRILNDGEHGMTLATLANVFIVMFESELTVDGVATLRRHQRAFIRELGGKRLASLGILDVDAGNVTRTSKEGREASTELARDLAPHVYGYAVVLDRKGFVASAIRSIITTVNLVAKTPMKTFDGVDPALDWLEARIGEERHPDYDRAAVLDAVSALRQRRSSRP